MTNIFEKLEGKKTYIAGACLFVYGIIQQDMESILIALGLLGLRNAI
jgi:hypothetical protein